MAFWVYILKCADGKFHTGHLAEGLGRNGVGYDLVLRKGCDCS